VIDDPSSPANSGPLPLRSADSVMRLQRMGCSFATRLSFLRQLLRTLRHSSENYSRRIWQMDSHGHGHAVYSIDIAGHQYSLVAFSRPLADAQRTDRVIATAWDSAFVLYDGYPIGDEINRLAANAPHQEAGRFSRRDLVLSRANKSVRLFNHVVQCLSAGRQPDPDQLHQTGYLMRTTAVYGNGKFGIADRDVLAERATLNAPFQLEMLTVWMIRAYTIDLVEHVARETAPQQFTPLDVRYRRYLGIGNSTGLGMAPFLATHPMLLNNWVTARETALARVRGIEFVADTKADELLQLMQRTQRHLGLWNVEDQRQQRRIELLRKEFAALGRTFDRLNLTSRHACERLYQASLEYSLECQELVIALLLEPHGELVDELGGAMGSDERFALDTMMKTGELLAILNQNMCWALDYDFTSEQADAQFWYVSEEKLEPRIGLRHKQAGAELEMPLDIARRVQALHHDLLQSTGTELLAEFLLRLPQHRDAAWRVQLSAHFPYAEIRDNLIADTCLPIDMLRFKLAFFGATRFDPRSELWTRITLFQGAPLAEDLKPAADETLDDSWDQSWMPIPA